MEDTSAQTIPVTGAPQKSFSKKIIFFVGVCLFILGVSLTLIILKPFLISSSNQKITQEQSSQISSQVGEISEPSATNKILVGSFLPASEAKGLPGVLSMNKDGKEIKIFYPEIGETKSLPIKARCCGGALFIGSTGPLLSPSHKRIAYINEDDKNLWVIDSGRENNLKVSDQGKERNDLFWGTAISISGWSSDERWLIYQVTIEDEGMVTNPQDKFQPPILEGFYAADLKEGKIYFLPGLTTFVDFLPQSNLIVFVKEKREPEKGNQTDLYSYDLASKKIEKLGETMKGTFISQFSFSPDKKYFAYVIGETDPSLSRMVYSALDGSGDQELARGTFAEIQWPHISPDGRYVAYERSNPASCPDGGSGCPQAKLVIYDLNSETEKTYGEIKKILYWFDDNYLVVLGGKYFDPWSLQIVDTNTGSVKTVAENEKLRGQ